MKQTKSLCRVSVVNTYIFSQVFLLWDAFGGDNKCYLFHYSKALGLTRLTKADPAYPAVCFFTIETFWRRKRVMQIACSAQTCYGKQ